MSTAAWLNTSTMHSVGKIIDFDIYILKMISLSSVPSSEMFQLWT